MKGFTRICLLISLICVCIGAICLGAGVALGSGIREVWTMAGNGELDIGNLHIGSWNVPYFITDDEPENANIRKGVVKEQFLADDVENLELDIKYGTLYLTDSQTNQIEITVNAPRRNTYKCSLDGNTVKLLDQTSRHIWKAGLGKSNEVTVTVAVPKGKVFDEVELITNAGAVEISHNISASEVHFELDAGELLVGSVAAAEEFSVDVGAGSIEISDFTSEFLEVDCGVGQAILSGSVSQEADVDCGMGQITLTLNGQRDDYDYDISCGLGTVDINGESYSTLSTDKEIDNDSDRTISLKCGMGEIEVYVKED